MDKIGLTGSTGSLGKILTKYINNKKIFNFRGDVRKKKDLINWVEKNNINIIIHLAAIVPIKIVNKNRRHAWEVNYIGTKNIVNASIKKKIKWFFFSSTSHVYESSKKKITENSIKKPISFYGKTKLQAENYIIKKFNNKKIPYCIGRIFSTANKNQKKSYLIPDLKKKIKESNSKILLKNLNHYRDFISMQDISKIIYYLYKIKYNGVVNIASGKKIYLKDIATVILKKYQKNNYKFIDNKTQSSLVGDITKLKKIRKFKINSSIKNLIF